MWVLVGWRVGEHGAGCWCPRRGFTERCYGSMHTHQEPAILPAESCCLFTGLAPDHVPPDERQACSPAGRDLRVDMEGVTLSHSWALDVTTALDSREAWAMFHIPPAGAESSAPRRAHVLTATATPASLLEHREC